MSLSYLDCLTLESDETVVREILEGLWETQKPLEKYLRGGSQGR